MCVVQRGLGSPGIAVTAGAGISSDAGSPAQAQGGPLRPGGHLRRPPGPMGILQMTPQVRLLSLTQFSLGESGIQLFKHLSTMGT